jgi:hypothetical protein
MKYGLAGVGHETWQGVPTLAPFDLNPIFLLSDVPEPGQ